MQELQAQELLELVQVRLQVQVLSLCHKPEPQDCPKANHMLSCVSIATLPAIHYQWRSCHLRPWTKQVQECGHATDAQASY